MSIGQKLKRKRLALKLTQEEVAEKIFVSRQSISNWENNKNMPDIESLIRISKLLDISLDNLLVEGSAIVKDIKAKTDLGRSKRVGMIVAIVNLLIIASLQFVEKNPKITIILLLSATILNSLGVMVYFARRIKLMEGLVLSKEERKYDKPIVILTLLFIVGAIIYQLIK